MAPPHSSPRQGLDAVDGLLAILDLRAELERVLLVLQQELKLLLRTSQRKWAEGRERQKHRHTRTLTHLSLIHI